MPPRQKPWPTQWLITDERMGEQLWDAIGRLDARDGIVLRHYRLDGAARRELADALAKVCRQRGIMLAVAGDSSLATDVRADLVHNSSAPTGTPFSRSVHSVDEAEAARRAGAALVFVSPVNSTRSHPGQEPLSRAQAIRIARVAQVPAIALGGMDPRKFKLRFADDFYGWAGIDAWLTVTKVTR